MATEPKGDGIIIHKRSLFIGAIAGLVLGATGLRVIAPFIPGMDEAIERQQKIQCAELVAKTSVSNMEKVLVLEKRVSALEATLKAHGIDIPGE